MIDEAYVVASKGYRVVPPTGWTRITSDADLALRHPTLAAGLMAHGTCEGRQPRRPLGVVARHLRFGLENVTGLVEAATAVAGHPGIRSRFTARLDGIPVAVDAVALRAGRCVYDLAVVAPPERIDAVRGDFDHFAASFELLRVAP